MAEWLAHHVDRPVAVIGHHPDPTIRNVLIGVDGSDGSRAAAAWVRDLAARSPGVLVVAASVEPPRPEWTADDYPADRRRDLERRIRDDFASELTGLDIDLEVAAVLGANAADALVAAARERQCDLVVVGARGLGGLTGLRVGGIALRTLHEADRSIVLIPPR
jgi:nucleotide-binding universal stress UspA family protein